MNTNRHRKARLLFFSVLAIGAVSVLVSGISTLDLDSATGPLPRMQPPAQALPGAAPRVPGIADTVLQLLFAISGALLPFAIIYCLVSPEGRKQVLRNLIVLLILLTPLYLLWRAQLGSGAVGELLLPQAAPPGSAPAPDVVLALQPPRWLVLVATATVALLVAALLVTLGWAIWRRRQRQARSLERLARPAQEAIDAIDAGADLKDTVTRCYFEMMQVLRQERGIQRQPFMTPREFERKLEQIGMPTTQMGRLTRLFEEARYGDKQLGNQEEHQARVALTFIVRFCRGTP